MRDHSYYDDIDGSSTLASKPADADGVTAVGYGVTNPTNYTTLVGALGEDGEEIGEGGAALLQGIEVTQTASFGILAKHIGRFIPANHGATPIVATIPLDATIDIPLGAMFEVGCQGAADVTIAIAGGGTLIGTVTATTAGQVLKARKIDVNTWWVSLTS